MTQRTLWKDDAGHYEIALHETEALMVIDNFMGVNDWPMLTGTGVVYDRPDLWPVNVKDKTRAFLWQLRTDGPEQTQRVYTCGVPFCERDATQVVRFYSDTYMLIRGAETTAKEGQHEFFCDQCYQQAGFTSKSDIAAIPICDYEDDLEQTEEPDDPITEQQIWAAWRELDPTREGPDTGNYRAAFEHGQWWVTGYDPDDEPRNYSVVEASGPGSAYGLDFEEV